MTAPHGNDNSSHLACREAKVYHNTLRRIVENPKCLIPWPNPNPNPNPDVIKSRHCNLTLTDVTDVDKFSAAPLSENEGVWAVGCVESST